MIKPAQHLILTMHMWKLMVLQKLKISKPCLQPMQQSITETVLPEVILIGNRWIVPSTYALLESCVWVLFNLTNCLLSSPTSVLSPVSSWFVIYCSVHHHLILILISAELLETDSQLQHWRNKIKVMRMWENGVSLQNPVLQSCCKNQLINLNRHLILKWNSPCSRAWHQSMLSVMIHCSSRRERSPFSNCVFLDRVCLWVSLSHRVKYTFNHLFISSQTAVFGLQPQNKPLHLQTDFTSTSCLYVDVLCCESF